MAVNILVLPFHEIFKQNPMRYLVSSCVCFYLLKYTITLNTTYLTYIYLILSVFIILTKR